MPTKRPVKIGYKLFITSPLRSAFYQGRTITYSPDKRTYKQIFDGALAVFKTREDAERFAKHYTLRPIFKIRYRPSKTRELFYMHEKNKKSRLKNFPRGTDFADWIEILEKHSLGGIKHEN